MVLRRKEMTSDKKLYHISEDKTALKSPMRRKQLPVVKRKGVESRLQIGITQTQVCHDLVTRYCDSDSNGASRKASVEIRAAFIPSPTHSIIEILLYELHPEGPLELEHTIC